MSTRQVIVGVALAALVAACGGSDSAEQNAVESAQNPASSETSENAAAVDADDAQDTSAEDLDAFEGAPGQMRVVVGDIDYSIDGLLCTISDGELGATGQFFINGGNTPYTAFYAYARLENLVNERLTVTGPDGNLFLEHKQIEGAEVLNTQTQSPGSFLFDPAAPSLDFDSEVLFTVASPAAEGPVEVLGTLTVDC